MRAPYPLVDDGHLQALLAHNAKVYIAARSQEKGQAAIEHLQKVTGKKGIFLKLDLADLKAVKSAAEDFLRLIRCSLRCACVFQLMIRR